MRSPSLYLFLLLISVLFSNRVTAFTFRNTRVTIPAASSTVVSSSYLDRLSKPSSPAAVVSSSYLDRLGKPASPSKASAVSSSYLDSL